MRYIIVLFTVIFGCMRFLLSSILLYSIVVLTGLSSCTERSQEEALDDAVPDDFRTFYSQFFQDSSYQLGHIVFPLQGVRGGDDSDTATAFIPWERDTWRLHRPIQKISDYHHTFDILSDDLIVETIEERNAPIAMQRRFARMAEGWHLIYYIEMQPMSKKQTE